MFGLDSSTRSRQSLTERINNFIKLPSVFSTVVLIGDTVDN